MKLEDFRASLDSLITLYLENRENRKEMLSLWIKSFGEPEVNLIYLLLENKEDDNIRRLDTDPSLPDPRTFDPWNTTPEITKALYDWDFKNYVLYSLRRDIKDLTGVGRHIPPSIDSTLLVSPIRHTLFNKAEAWVSQQAYLDGSGNWVAGDNVLAAFLHVLIEARVLNKHKRSQLRLYFNKRYDCGLSVDTFKKNKILKSKKLDLFTDLRFLITHSPS